MALKLAELQKAIHLDGTMLEGGGQLLRLALSLSSLTRNSLHITDIRGKRGPVSKPGQDGGMKNAHLAGAEWLAKALDAETEGLELKSKELLFRPSIDAETERNSGIFESVKKKKKGRKTKKGTEESAPELWRISASGAGRLETTIQISTPGSVFLILQTILPWLLFQSSSADIYGLSMANTRQVRVKIEGGTHAWHAPSLEYMQQVLFPTLHEKVGLPFVEITVKRLGWSSGRASVGEVWFDFTPILQGASLPAFKMIDRGRITKIDVTIYAPTDSFRDGIRHEVAAELVKRIPGSGVMGFDINFLVDEESGHRNRCYLLLVAHTSNGYRLGRGLVAGSETRFEEARQYRQATRQGSRWPTEGGDRSVSLCR